MGNTRRGRPVTPCPRCGEGRRSVQVLVQSRPIPTLKKPKQATLGSNSVTVCAKCAGALRAKLTMLIEGETRDVT